RSHGCEGEPPRRGGGGPRARRRYRSVRHCDTPLRGGSAAVRDPDARQPGCRRGRGGRELRACLPSPRELPGADAAPHVAVSHRDQPVQESSGASVGCGRATRRCAARGRPIRQRGGPGAGGPAPVGGAGARGPLARQARGVRAEARGGVELRGDGGRHRGAHSDAQDARASRPGGAAEGAGGPHMNAIDPRMHQALDGELDWDAVPAELRRTVARLTAAAELLAAPPPGLVPSVERRVMAEIRRPAPSRARLLMRWFVTPRAIIFRVRPAWSLAFAVVAAAVTLFTVG